MRILQFGKYYFPYVGGMETVSFTLTEGLNEAGIHCEVLCSNDKNINVDETINGYSVYRVKRFGELAAQPLSPGLITKLYSLSKKKQYDIIHFHHPDPLSALAFFLVRPSSKLIIHWHLDIVKQKFIYFFYRPLEKWLLKRAASVIVTSPKYLEGSKPLQAFKDKTVVIPLGIRSPRPPDISKVEEIRQKYAGKKIIFALGRFTAYKGFEFLIRSAKYLPDNYLILIGGGGPLKHVYEQELDTLQLHHKVLLLGKISEADVQNHYKACDVFCLPSITKNEAFGLVLVEAMSYGKPLVATTIEGSGTSWVNADGISGLNVPPMQAKAIADAVVKITSDELLAKEFSKGSRIRFETLFSADKMVNLTLELYKSVLNR